MNFLRIIGETEIPSFINMDHVIEIYPEGECTVFQMDNGEKRIFSESFDSFTGAIPGLTEANVKQDIQYAHWIPDESMDDIYYRYFRCSRCGKEFALAYNGDVYKAMPSCTCGAVMRREP